MKVEKERLEYIDVARAIAIILITSYHALTRSFSINSNTQSEFQSIPLLMTILKAMIYAFSRIGVPFFLMISGALLLPKNFGGEDTAKRFIRHNWLSLFLTTEIWMIIMFWYKQILPESIIMKEGVKYCILRFFMTICFIDPVTMETMWYMPMILCVYLMIPIFATALKNIPLSYFILPCSLVVFSSFVIPVINGVLIGMGFSQQIETKLNSANLFSMYMLILLIGYLIREGYLDLISSKYLIIVGCLSTVCLLCLQIWMWSTEFEYKFGLQCQDIFLLIGSSCFFELIKRTPFHPSIVNISRKLAEISFGIYFIHICIMAGLNEVMNRYMANITYFHKFLFLEIISFFGSILIIQNTKKKQDSCKVFIRDKKLIF